MIWALLALQLAAETVNSSNDNFGKPFAPNGDDDVRLFVINLQGCNQFAGEPTGGAHRARPLFWPTRSISFALE